MALEIYTISLVGLFKIEDTHYIMNLIFTQL